jgi:hypothetical protein
VAESTGSGASGSGGREASIAITPPVRRRSESAAQTGVIAQVLSAFSAASIGALVAGRLTDVHTWVPRRPVSPPPERERSAVLH